MVVAGVWVGLAEELWTRRQGRWQAAVALCPFSSAGLLHSRLLLLELLLLVQQQLCLVAV